MQTVIIVIHLMIVVTMIGLVLLQKSEGGGLGMGGGGFMTSRGTANILTRATAILAGAFFITSISLSILAGFDRRPQSILPANPTGPSAPVSGTPVPGAPAQPGSGGILDTLRQPPSEPQAPQSR